MSVDNRSKCFATPEALHKFEPETLCRFLMQYPAYVMRRLGPLPSQPTEKNLPYERIIPMFMDDDEDTPADFLEKMVLIIEMSTPQGHDKLKAEAEHQRIAYESFRGKTFHDTAMRAALLPGDLLDRAHARVVIFRKRRFAYFSPALGEVPPYHPPTQQALDGLAEKLTFRFHGVRAKLKAKVMAFDFENEIWFVIRRGGQPTRLGIYDEDIGEPISRFFIPETYDGVVFNKLHGELRILAQVQEAMQTGYLQDFGEILAGSQQFFSQRTIFFPEQVALLRHDDLFWEGTQKFQSIRLAECRYLMPNGETVMLKRPKCLLHKNEQGRLIPQDVEKVLYAEFQFKFASDRRERSVRVDAGNEATYMRDSDTALLEDWLRAKKLMWSVCHARHRKAA